ncbi:MAG TPA: hypothetical protein VG916_06555, partial [Gemmatimonadaceae bacterium]|nr:hypothetical protein [Gemmatimonadaceae bacterium]
ARTDLERAFAGAATAADRRARKVRMGAVGVVIAALAGIAVVMAYLSIDAKRSRDEADARLTASLVAQGTSQLNDGRELAALAYFAEAMRRGADGVGLREMIAIASRGWKDTVSTQPGVLSVAALPGEAGFLAGTRDSHVRWLGMDGAVVGDVQLELGPITAIRAHGGKMVVIGDKGVAVVAASCCTVLARIPHEAFVHGAAVGPGADEVSTLEKDGVHVYGWDGTARRSAAAIPGKTFADIAFDPAGTRALVWSEGKLAAVDLVSMEVRTVTEDLHGELASSADDGTFAYLDEARAVHVVDATGAAVAPVVHPANRASAVWLSPAGDRVLAISEHEATVLARDGAELRGFATETAAGAMVRGDDVWTVGHDGKVRRYHDGVLVASVPAHAGDVVGFDLAGDRVASLGSDGLLVVTKASAEQFVVAPLPCERTTQWAVQYGIMSMCEDGRVLLNVGAHELGTAPKIADDSPMIAWDRALGVGAIEAADVVKVVDAKGGTLAISSGRVKPLDVQVEDARHLLVLENPEGPIWRWAFQEGDAGWTKVIDAAGATSIGAVAGGGVAVAYEDGHVSCFVGAAETWRLDAGGRTAWIAVSRDGRRLALQMVTGAVVIADAVTGAVTQRLPAGDATDVAPSFDETGEMLIRPAAGVTTIWDVEHGLPLVTGLDLLKVPSGVVFASGGGGGLELQGERTGELRLTRDTRPAEAVLEDIACHVPLAVVKDRLEAVTPPRCPG